jgi:hypothetical protein
MNDERRVRVREAIRGELRRQADVEDLLVFDDKRESWDIRDGRRRWMVDGRVDVDALVQAIEVIE